MDQQKTVISSIVCRKTSAENCYFQHSMLRKPVRKFPRLLTRKISSIVNKAYNGEKIFTEIHCQGLESSKFI